MYCAYLRSLRNIDILNISRDLIDLIWQNRCGKEAGHFKRNYLVLLQMGFAKPLMSPSER